MKDLNFERSILICEHSSDGSFGYKLDKLNPDSIVSDLNQVSKKIYVGKLC